MRLRLNIWINILSDECGNNELLKYKFKMQPKFDKKVRQEVKKELEQQYISNVVSQAKEQMMK
jgi:hypothetical protein